jgi:UDP-N-acetylmuramate dehydrogenase
MRDVRLGRDVPMAPHTSFGVGGPADLFIEPRTHGALAASLRLVRAEGLPYLLLGRGTNVVVSDAGVRGAVISTYPLLAQATVAGSRLVASAGALVGGLVHRAADAGLSGVEALAGIPGTLGGGLHMNAGAHGTTLSDVVESVTAMDADGAVATLRKDELDFGHRVSSIQRLGQCVLEATLRLAASDPARIHRRMYEIASTRCQSQPVSARSAGSIFKRPRGDYAGRLLEEAGAKGMCVGDAQISPKHANFIVNTGHATAADVLELIARARRCVHERFGVWLEPEVCLVGEGMEMPAQEGCRAAT